MMTVVASASAYSTTGLAGCQTGTAARSASCRQRILSAPQLVLSDKDDDGYTTFADALANRQEARTQDTFTGKVVPTAVDVAVAAPAATPDDEYQRGLATVAFITLLFSSNSIALRAAFTAVEHVPPVLLLNAIVSCAALTSLVAGGPLLNSVTSAPSTLADDATDEIDAISLRAGAELGLLKCLGTSANLYGLSLTSADHGAFLIQLTTLIVPVAQGVSGVPIPRRIWAAVGIALTGLLLFTFDPDGGASSVQGDLACIVAACFYAAYDLRLFVWGKRVTSLRLITNKVASQAALSLAALAVIGGGPTLQFFAEASGEELAAIAPLVLWSGIVVNGVAPFLQVGGQQAVGPARAQVKLFITLHDPTSPSIALHLPISPSISS